MEQNRQEAISQEVVEEAEAVEVVEEVVVEVEVVQISKHQTAHPY
jgi:hypothetical protein